MEKINREEFMQLVHYMRENYGINLEQKMTLVEGRLSSVMNQKGFTKLSEYFDYVVSDKSGEEAKTLITRLTTNYTYFMREDQHYKFLVEEVLPNLTPTLRDRDLRIWSAGCSSGEEPYTTAMVLDDYFGPAKSQWDTKVLATDISPSVLNMAKEAVYPAERLQNISPAWKAKYFNKLDQDNYQVKDFVRSEVILRSFNLMEKTFPFRKRFHVIFCRNVMIYFNRETRDNLISKFYKHIEPGGYLFIGLSETISGNTAGFQFVKPSIYRKGG